jgi:hypothetical protein
LPIIAPNLKGAQYEKSAVDDCLDRVLSNGF